MKIKQTLKIFGLLPFLIAALSSTIRGELQDGQRSEIDRSVVAAVRPKIFEQVLKDHPDLLECLKEDGEARKEEYLANISIEAIDLNRDRQPEIFVEPSGGCDCGARNCSLWVYQQASTGYSLILEGDGLGLSVERTNQ